MKTLTPCNLFVVITDLYIYLRLFIFLYIFGLHSLQLFFVDCIDTAILSRCFLCLHWSDICFGVTIIFFNRSGITITSTMPLNSFPSISILAIGYRALVPLANLHRTHLSVY